MIEADFKIDGVKSFDDLKKLTQKGVRLFLFGEAHGFLNELEIQKKIINSIKPKYYLYELLEEEKIFNSEDFDRFLSQPDDTDFSVISSYKELKPAVLM